MTLTTSQRAVFLGGLLAATLAAAAWVSDPGKYAVPRLEEATSRFGAMSSPASARRTAPAVGVAQVNLDILKRRGIGSVKRDPFALPRPAPAKEKPAPVPKIAEPAALPQPGAPPLPFSYMGKLLLENGIVVFLTQGERSLVVREGETIDSKYRVDRITQDSITLTYLPANQRQTIVFGEPQ